MAASAPTPPDPHRLLTIVKALYPHAELFQQAAPHALLIARVLDALVKEGEGLRETFVAVANLPKRQRADVYHGLASGLAGRYGDGESVEFWNVMLSSIAELADQPIAITPALISSAKPEAPSPAKRVRTARPQSRLTADQVEARIFALNTCGELIGTVPTLALSRQLNDVGVKIDRTSLSKIRSGRMARVLKQGKTNGVCGMRRLEELRAGLELLADQQGAAL